MSDILTMIMNDRDPVSKLIAKIPGFSGYMDRSSRRTADKLLRDTIANQYESIYKKISLIQTDLIANGGIEYIDDIERAAIQVRRFTDRLRNATYGYSGFFDGIKVDAEEIGEMYHFDLAFVQIGEHLNTELETLSGNIGNSEGLPAFIRNVTTLSRELNETFDKRNDLLNKPEAAAS